MAAVPLSQIEQFHYKLPDLTVLAFEFSIVAALESWNIIVTCVNWFHCFHKVI